jgi:hypothetical protein
MFVECPGSVTVPQVIITTFTKEAAYKRAMCAFSSPGVINGRRLEN